MGKSVKLTDGSYIDSEGVYDVTQSKTQKAINADISNRYLKGQGLYTLAWTNTYKKDVTVTIHAYWYAPILLCMNIQGKANLYLCCTNRNNSMQVSKIVEAITGYTPTVSITESPNRMIVSIPAPQDCDLWAITNREITFTVPS